jgi:hypothetical protein
MPKFVLLFVAICIIFTLHDCSEHAYSLLGLAANLR